MDDEPEAPGTIKKVLIQAGLTQQAIHLGPKMIHATDRAIVSPAIIAVEGLQLRDVPLMHEPYTSGKSRLRPEPVKNI